MPQKKEEEEAGEWEREGGERVEGEEEWGGGREEGEMRNERGRRRGGKGCQRGTVVEAAAGFSQAGPHRPVIPALRTRSRRIMNLGPAWTNRKTLLKTQLRINQEPESHHDPLHAQSSMQRTEL